MSEDRKRFDDEALVHSYVEDIDKHHWAAIAFVRFVRRGLLYSLGVFKIVKHGDSGMNWVRHQARQEAETYLTQVCLRDHGGRWPCIGNMRDGV